MQVPQVLLAAAVADDPFAHPGHQVVADRGAAVVRDQAETVDAQLVEQSLELDGHSFLPVVAGALVGLAVTPEVDGQASVGAAQGFQGVVPLPPRVGDAVQEDHGLGVGGAAFDQVPAHLLTVAGGVYEAVHDADPVQLLGLTVMVRLGRRDVGQCGQDFLDRRHLVCAG